MYSQFENISFLPDNVYSSDGSPFAQSFCYDGTVSNVKVVNSLICTKCDAGNSVTNCVFYNGVKREGFVNATYVSSVEALKLDGWVPRFDSPLTDAGTNACACVTDPGTYAVDGRGCPRVMNGTIDIGAVEADWRPVYSADLRSSLVSVKSASPCVTETARKGVSLGADGVLVVTCLRGAESAVPVLFPFFVTGNGTLTVTPEGGEAQVFTASDEKQVCKVEGIGPQKVTFAYVPGEGDVGSAELLRARREQGLMIMVR